MALYLTFQDVGTPEDIQVAQVGIPTCLYPPFRTSSTCEYLSLLSFTGVVSHAKNLAFPRLWNDLQAFKTKRLCLRHNICFEHWPYD